MDSIQFLSKSQLPSCTEMNGQAGPKIHIEMQGTQNNQSNPEK